MKQSTTRFPFHVLVAILLLCFSGLAQPPQDKRAKQDLALEVTRPGDRTMEIPAFDGGGGAAANFRRIADWKPASEGEIVKSLNIKIGREAEVVITHLSVTMENEKVVEIGIYRLRENESAKTEELTKFGVEAIILKVIKAKPNREDPPTAIQPLILNKTKALEVVSFYPTPGSSPSFQLTLKKYL